MTTNQARDDTGGRCGNRHPIRSHEAMMIAPHAGIAPNALHSSISISLCKPKGSPCVKRPRRLRFPAARFRPGGRYQESLDEHPAVVAFFQSAPGLAFLHRLVLGIHLVCTEVGACGIRLVCLLLTLTGLDRFVAASYGTQHQVNRQVEEAIVSVSPRGKRAFGHKTCPPKTSPWPRMKRLPAGCAWWRWTPRATTSFWSKRPKPAIKTRGMRSWRRRLRVSTVRSYNRPAMKHRACWPTWSITSVRTTRRTSSMCSMSWSKPSAVPWPPSSGRRPRRPARRKSGLSKCKGNFRARATRLHKRGPGRPPQAAASLEQLEQDAQAARQEFERISAQREQVAQSIRTIGQAYHFVDLERGVRRNGRLIAADIQAAD